jgi:NO-binding membrane sensor protein with MHYT domain
VSLEQDEPAIGRRWFAWRHRWTLWLVLVAACVAGLTFFVAANYVHVELRLFLWQGEVRISWIGLGALAIGFGLGLIAGRLIR